MLDSVDERVVLMPAVISRAMPSARAVRCTTGARRRRARLPCARPRRAITLAPVAHGGTKVALPAPVARASTGRSRGFPGAARRESDERAPVPKR